MARDKKRRKQAHKSPRPSLPPLPKQAAAVPRGDGGHPAASLPALNLDRRLTIRLDAERFADLEAYARREGFSVSLVVRHLVCRFLEDHRRLRSRP